MGTDSSYARRKYVELSWGEPPTLKAITTQRALDALIPIRTVSADDIQVCTHLLPTSYLCSPNRPKFVDQLANGFHTKIYLNVDSISDI